MGSIFDGSLLVSLSYFEGDAVLGKGGDSHSSALFVGNGNSFLSCKVGNIGGVGIASLSNSESSGLLGQVVSGASLGLGNDCALEGDLEVVKKAGVAVTLGTSASSFGSRGGLSGLETEDFHFNILLEEIISSDRHGLAAKGNL